MAKPKVFVTRVILDKGLDLVKEFCDVDLWTEELPPAREVVLARVRGVQGIRPDRLTPERRRLPAPARPEPMSGLPGQPPGTG